MHPSMLRLGTNNDNNPACVHHSLFLQFMLSRINILEVPCNGTVVASLQLGAGDFPLVGCEGMLQSFLQPIYQSVILLVTT